MVTLSDLSAGDRVRVTLEGTVKSVTPVETTRSHPKLTLVLDNAYSNEVTDLTLQELSAPTAKLEKLLPKIEAGDWVVVDNGYWMGTALGATDKWVWIDNDGGVPRTFDLNQVTKTTPKKDA